MQFIKILAVGVLTALAVAGAGSTPGELSPSRIVGLEYPRLANTGRVQGVVELAAFVHPDGHVREVRLLSGHPLLVPAARDALLKWRFVGCLSPSACEAHVFFKFELVGPCDRNTCPTEFQVDLPDRVSLRSARLPPMIN